ncbi:hypothetical protein BN1723_019973, partial [Verticillium longisporum]
RHCPHGPLLRRQAPDEEARRACQGARRIGR